MTHSMTLMQQNYFFIALSTITKEPILLLWQSENRVRVKCLDLKSVETYNSDHLNSQVNSYQHITLHGHLVQCYNSDFPFVFNIHNPTVCVHLSLIASKNFGSSHLEH
jgi:hypothetical protein